jgi:hypothetical protein
MRRRSGSEASRTMSQRTPNAIDFWRGYALATIYINHVPGIYFERFTHRNFGFSDSAELFVFLAGWSVRLLLGSTPDALTTQRMVLRVGARAVTLYAAQILITMIAIALLAASALLLENPLLLQWHNAAAVFEDPVSAHVGLVLLTHQLGYFDILPLYVVLMFGAIVMAVFHRYAPRLLLPTFLAIYLAVLMLRINLPSWPVEGFWFFNPFAWQFIFLLGFLMAANEDIGGFVRRHIRVLRWLGLLGVLLGLRAMSELPLFDLFGLPPQLVYLLAEDKTYLSPIRLLHALALFAAMSAVFPLIFRHLRPLARFFSMLGRNSLYVFCVGSILSLCAQIVRFYFQSGVATDAALVAAGIALLGFTAWLSELRDRLKSAPASSSR